MQKLALPIEGTIATVDPIFDAVGFDRAFDRFFLRIVKLWLAFD